MSRHLHKYKLCIQLYIYIYIYISWQAITINACKNFSEIEPCSPRVRILVLHLKQKLGSLFAMMNIASYILTLKISFA